MTDHAPTPDGQAPDDPFERALRSALRDRAAGPLPPTLRLALTEVSARGVPVAARGAGRWRPIAGLAAAAAAVLLLVVWITPLRGWVEGMVLPPAAPASPDHGTAVVTGSPSPSAVPSPSLAAAPAFDWSSPMVTLTAADIVLTAGGVPILVPPALDGYNDPGDQRFRTLELEWQALGRGQRLYLYFAADATHWWVSEARIYDNREQTDWIYFPGPLFKTPIGQPFHGEISLSSTDGAVPGSIRMTGVTLDPTGLGTGPRTFDDCRTMDQLPKDVQDLLQAFADPGRLDALAREQQLCLVYRWTYPTATGASVGETWCTLPPSGMVRYVGEGDRGETIVFVDDETIRLPRKQPLEGWGCGAPDASPSAGPSGSLPPAASASPGIELGFDWSDGTTTFRGEAMVLAAGDDKTEMRMVAKVPFTVAPIRRAVAPGVVELTWDWIADDVKRLSVQVATDGTRWHVSELGFTDRMLDDTLRRWTDVPIEGAVGAAWSGDLTLKRKDAVGGPAEVQLSGVTLDPGITTADLASPAPRSPAPDRPFAIDNGHVRLTADALELTHRGDTLRGPDGVVGSDTPPNVLQRDSLQTRWMDGDLLVQLKLEFSSDGDRWRVSDGWIAGWGVGWAPLELPQVTAALGTAWTGNLDVRLPQMNPGSGKEATGDELHLVVRNLSVEPFRAAVARTMTDCSPVIEPTKAARRIDPAAEGQPLATKGIVGLPAEKAAGVLEDLGSCYLFDLRLTPDPSLGVSGILETWCDAPSGEVAAMRYGKGGEVHLVVVREVPKGTPKRPQPLMGWGCREGSPVASEPPMPTPEPAAALGPVAPATDKAYAWDNGAMRIGADDVTLTIGDRTIHPEPGLRGAMPDAIDGRPQLVLRLDDQTEVRVSFTSDGTAWSVHDAQVYGGGLTDHAALSVGQVGAPLGQVFTGDVVITGPAPQEDGGVPVTLTVTGAEIAAYRPVVARTLRDCQMAEPLSHGNLDASAPGELLDGLGLVGKPASKAADALQRLGYCYLFSVVGPSIQNPDHTTTQLGETWCDTPDGKVTRVITYPDGWIFVDVKPTKPMEPRAQPAVGWGCLSDVPGYASPAP